MGRALGQLSAALVLLGALAGCGGASVGPATGRPAPDLARCDKDPARLVLLRRSPEARAALEVRLPLATAVVSYVDCKLVVLPDCTAPAGYEYVPVQRAQQPLRFPAPSDDRAGDYVSGAGADLLHRFGAEIGGEAKLVGIYHANRASFSTADLHGECAAATHVVHSVLMGAVAQGGADAATGPLAACEASRLSDARPPPGCDAAIQIELEPLKDASFVASTGPAAPRPAVDLPSAASEDPGRFSRSRFASDLGAGYAALTTPHVSIAGRASQRMGTVSGLDLYVATAMRAPFGERVDGTVDLEGSTILSPRVDQPAAPAGTHASLYRVTAGVTVSYRPAPSFSPFYLGAGPRLGTSFLSADGVLLASHGNKPTYGGGSETSLLGGLVAEAGLWTGSIASFDLRLRYVHALEAGSSSDELTMLLGLGF